MVSLSNGELLAIAPCEVGQHPINAGGELVCRSCENGSCNNVLNKVDALEIDMSELRTAYFETYEALAGVGMLLNQPRRGLEQHFSTGLKKSRLCGR